MLARVSQERLPSRQPGGTALANQSNGITDFIIGGKVYQGGHDDEFITLAMITSWPSTLRPSLSNVVSGTYERECFFNGKINEIARCLLLTLLRRIFFSAD